MTKKKSLFFQGHLQVYGYCAIISLYTQKKFKDIYHFSNIIESNCWEYCYIYYIDDHSKECK